MLATLPTSCLIIAWCALLGYGWASACFWWGASGQRRLRARHPAAAASPWSLLPALVLALVVIVYCQRFWQVSLIFPLQLDLSAWRLLAVSLPPALVLCLASGMLFHLRAHLSEEIERWQEKPFVMVTKGRGCSPRAALRKIVMLRALTASWRETLPWLFSELVVVEAIFNAPGLGLEAWHHARSHDYGGLGIDLLGLAGLYVVLYGLNFLLQRTLGQKLASYH